VLHAYEGQFNIFANILLEPTFPLLGVCLANCLLVAVFIEGEILILYNFVPVLVI
jgi:hypothetical protein